MSKQTIIVDSGMDNLQTVPNLEEKNDLFKLIKKHGIDNPLVEEEFLKISNMIVEHKKLTTKVKNQVNNINQLNAYVHTLKDNADESNSRFQHLLKNGLENYHYTSDINEAIVDVLTGYVPTSKQVVYETNARHNIFLVQADKIPVPILDMFLECLDINAIDENEIVIDGPQLRDIVIRLANNKPLDISPIACDHLTDLIEKENQRRLEQMRMGMDSENIHDFYKLGMTYQQTDDAINSEVYYGEELQYDMDDRWNVIKDELYGNLCGSIVQHEEPLNVQFENSEDEDESKNLLNF